jgi:hypothetical protein
MVVTLTRVRFRIADITFGVARNTADAGQAHYIGKAIYFIQRNSSPGLSQGCQMVCFLTKNPNLGKFWRVLQWKRMGYFMDTWSILRFFDKF